MTDRELHDLLDSAGDDPERLREVACLAWVRGGGRVEPADPMRAPVCSATAAATGLLVLALLAAVVRALR